MDFGKNLLQKYGWKEGKGLGKDEDGICKPLKSSLKFDTCGVGYEHGQEYTRHWWEEAYNTAASNISDNVSMDMTIINNNESDATTKRVIDNLRYANYSTSFIKTSTLTGSQIVTCPNVGVISVAVKKIHPASDDKLFAACEGRTGHKTARHGLNLSGKLSRIEKQERWLLKHLKRVSLTDQDNTKNDNNRNIEKKLKKLNSVKKLKKHQSMQDDSDEGQYNPFAAGCTTPKKNKNKKERKRVSFNETITEYHSQDAPASVNYEVDSGSQSDASSRPATPLISVKKEKIKIKDETPFIYNFEEPIDSFDITNTPDIGVSDFQEKIRQENRRMRRILKRMRKLENALERKSKNSDSEVADTEIIKDLKRKSKRGDGDIDRYKKNKHITFEQDVKSHSHSKKPKLTIVIEPNECFSSEYMSNRISNVADILNSSCKISDA